MAVQADAFAAFHPVQQRFYAGDADTAALARMLTDDVVWHVPGSSVIAGDHQDAMLCCATSRCAVP